jgi:hypothetical protein
MPKRRNKKWFTFLGILFIVIGAMDFLINGFRFMIITYIAFGSVFLSLAYSKIPQKKK